MELRHLRYFIAVAEELHFGRAAERLCISQPPLSMQIQQLERQLGFALFFRTKRHVELSPAGRHFLDEARDILSSLERATAAARRVARGEAGWLGIGFVGSATYEVLPALLQQFRQEFPDVELVLRELASARQAQSIKDGRIHVGLARPAIDEPGIRCEPILRELLVAALPSNHPLTERERIGLADLAEEPFILFPRHPKPSYGDYLFEVCEAAGFRPNAVEEVAEMHTAVGLVAAGLGVTLVPSCVRNETRLDLTFRRLAPSAPVTELSLIYRDADPTPTLSEFLRIVRTQAGSNRQKLVRNA